MIMYCSKCGGTDFEENTCACACCGEAYDRTTVYEPSIYDRIRIIRRAAGLSQGQLADRCKLSRNTIASLERGEANPLLGTLEIVFHVLGYDLDLVLVKRDDKG